MGGAQRVQGSEARRAAGASYGIGVLPKEPVLPRALLRAAPALTFFRLLRHTVSTNERVLRSRTRLWKSG